MTAPVLAIDGGNSKTDVALVGADGQVLGYARGPGSCHQNIGIAGTVSVLAALVEDVAAQAGFEVRGPVAEHASAYLAGADLPVEVDRLADHIGRQGWAGDLVVDNDTFALLRTGTESPSAVAVVCGAGVNCVGVSARGGRVRFPSLGRISGDWGGGGALGMEALWLAARDEDGRGTPTALRAAVREHFGRATVQDVSAAFHLGELPLDRLHELVPVLFSVAASGDGPATAVVERMGDEVVLLAVAALTRLDLLESAADVVLGGRVLGSRHPMLLDRVEAGLAARAPRAQVVVVDEPPIVGAALLGFDALGADRALEARLRSDLLAHARHRASERVR